MAAICIGAECFGEEGRPNQSVSLTWTAVIRVQPHKNGAGVQRPTIPLVDAEKSRFRPLLKAFVYLSC